MRRATGRDALHDVLRVVGDLTPVEVAARVLEGLDSGADAGGAPNRAPGGPDPPAEASSAGSTPADAGLYRDALGAAPPSGLPAAFLEEVPDALSRLVRRYAATHGPFTDAELRDRYGVDCSAVLAALERAGELVRGELRPLEGISPGARGQREWCDPEVLRRIRRASLAVLRKEIEPVDQKAPGPLPARLAERRSSSPGRGRRGSAA